MPALLYLEQFGSHVWDAFGHPPYLVGTSLTSKEWRDVDVRLILPDEEYERLFWPLPAPDERTSGKWVALCMAFSALGQQMTALPVDFQIQNQLNANETYKGKPRQALGFIELRIQKPASNSGGG